VGSSSKKGPRQQDRALAMPLFVRPPRVATYRGQARIFQGGLAGRVLRYIKFFSVGLKIRRGIQAIVTYAIRFIDFHHNTESLCATFTMFPRCSEPTDLIPLSCEETLGGQHLHKIKTHGGWYADSLQATKD
jgi:hypothetical protein